MFMDFKTYLMGMSVDARVGFASRCGTSKQHLLNIAYCGRKPNESLCINIERESKGQVRCEELRPDVDWKVLRKSCRKAA